MEMLILLKTACFHVIFYFQSGFRFPHIDMDENFRTLSVSITIFINWVDLVKRCSNDWKLGRRESSQPLEPRENGYPEATMIIMAIMVKPVRAIDTSIATIDHTFIATSSDATVLSIIQANFN